MVWFDGMQHRDDAFMISASGYKSALRGVVKVHKLAIKKMLLFEYGDDPEHGDQFYLGKKVLIHVEKGSGDKRNRLMYYVTFGKRFGIKSIE